MGLLSGTLLLPLAPVRGLIRLGEVIQRQVEQEMRNPARTRRQLEALAEARERGEISADEEQQVQQRILQARIKPGTPKAPRHEED